MGVPVIDPEDPAGYDCNYATKASSCNCTCTCRGNGSSSSSSYSASSSYSSSTTYSGSNSNSTSSSGSNSNSSHCCDSSSCSSCSKRNNHPAASTLTLTFANKNSCGAASNYHYSETEILGTPLNAPPIARLTKDLVGNSKEFRIENNKRDLRIIGNGNRIRIGNNHGNLQIIGNSTRLKITNNTGSIRYTGNEGRICLGSDSAQQIVDYIGNNGKLTVVKAPEMLSEKNKIHKQKTPKEIETATVSSTEKKCAVSASDIANGTTTESTQTILPSHSTPKKTKVKSASFGGDYSAQWRKFNELFQKQDWRNFESTSMPNLRTEIGEKPEAGDGKKAEQQSKNGKSRKVNDKTCKIDKNINIVSTYGNICIKNAVNVSM
ncbi:uncharacterized protein LOC128867857 isoform X1 [Anastrepha ludens]|uniref:uncharacterized protein LOC128867857 isoform X1 n=1 Tax=Anastrepha ludens TaxID=28586 RepID=UPI0023B14018|nr:uncharacterized protein LOC128867857 isoform X1 [Anastrepha ludens]